ncbi:acylphosphatase [Chloroflexota bacterium]
MVDLTSVQATVYGRVQGVFFRDFVVRRADELGVTGYVRNLPQGTVAVMAEGERKQLERLLGYLKEGPPAAKVAKVVVEWGEYTGSYSGFKIGYQPGSGCSS